MRVIEASESAPTGRHRVGMRDQGPAGEVVTEGTYRCANCGYSTQRFIWHCPSCKLWETVRPIQTLALETMLI